MIIDWLTYLGRFLLIMVIQLLLIGNLEISTLINPYIYLVFILTLPVNLKPWIVLILSFITGMIMDSFSTTPGLHMTATLAIGYLRTFYFRASLTKEDFEANIRPTPQEKGLPWFLVYLFSLTLLHHFILFYLEIFAFEEFFRTFSRVFMSTIASAGLITFGMLITYGLPKSR